MRTIAALFSVTVLTACATGPNYLAAEKAKFTQANHSAVDKLFAAPTVPIVKDAPLLIATMVNIDSLNQSSRFGRLISEQIATRLTQLGYNVVEMKLRNDVYIREGTGELLLSRDVRNLSRNYNAQVVVVGNYAVAAGYVYLTLKAVTIADNRVVAAVNYQLPQTENNKVLLAPPRE